MKKLNLKQESELRNKLAREAFLAWVEPSTIQGLPNLFRTKFTVFRILWLCTFVAALSLAASMIAMSVSSYLTFDVVTKIFRVDETTMVFPQITVCSSNQFTTKTGQTFVDKVLRDNQITNLVNSSVLTAMNPSNYSQVYNNYVSALYMASDQANNPNISSSERKLFSFNYSQLFISCQFNSEDCSSKDGWIEYKSQFYGMCFTFNSGRRTDGGKAELKTVSQESVFSSLAFELFVRPHMSENSLSVSYGAIVYIDRNGDHPSLSNIIKLSPGNGYHVGLEKTVHKRLPAPYSSCVNFNENGYESTISRLIKTTNLSYSQEYCYEVYMQTQVIEACQCYSIAYLPESNAKPCLTTKQNQCAIGVYYRLFTSDYKAKISSLCPAECESVRYTPRVSSDKYPTPNYGRSMLSNPRVAALFSDPSNVTTGELSESVLAVKIYMSEMRYTSVTEVASLTWDQLAANVGGYLGLFMGVSVLSLVELIEITLHIFYIMFVKKYSIDQI
jgi:hypothetical protein